MQPRSLLRVGITGTVVAVICFFTPVLVILFGVVGLSVAVGSLDYVLLPTLAVFVGITLYAMMKARKT